MPQVGRKHATEPFLLALDIGSSATRGHLYDARGNQLKNIGARVRHQMQHAEDGTNVCDAEAILHEVEQVIDEILDRAGKLRSQIRGVALDTFASTLVGVDHNARPQTPVYTYADSRPAADVAVLEQRFDERAVQQRTGARFHASYLPARFLWLARAEPDLLKRSEHWMSLGEFIYLRTLGRRGVAFSTAAWSGLLNRRTLTWDQELIEGLPLKVEQLSPLRDAGEPLSGLVAEYAGRWPALAQVPWFPAIADGYASNVGSEATNSKTLALSLGTSGAVRVLLEGTPNVPDGLWCYAVNRTQSLLGGALNDAGRAIGWLRGVLTLPADATFEPALAEPPGADTPVVLPFLTGERSPGWAAHATASISGLDLHSTPEAIFRGMLDGIGARLAAIADEIRQVAVDPDRVVVSGGAIGDLPAWLSGLAGMLQLPCTLSGEDQATMLGTALIALDQVAPKVKRSPAETGATAKPRAEEAAAYAACRERIAGAYRRLVAEQ